MADILVRLAQWSASDLDTHAVLLCDGAQVAVVPWVRHATDLDELLHDARAEIARLRSAEPSAAELDAAMAVDPLTFAGWTRPVSELQRENMRRVIEAAMKVRAG